MRHYMVKILAVLEVVVVAFVCVPLLTLGIYRLFPGFESWQMEALGFPFPVFVYVVMVALSLIAISLHGGKFAVYGIAFGNLKYHLDVAAVCFVPVALANLPFSLGVDHTTWSGALILAAVQIGLLFVLAGVLHGKPSTASLGIVGAGLVVLPGLNQAAASTAGKAIAIFLTYALFVGFGEEILYRGYMHSRLNEAFGKPYHFSGVAFGWGAIITAFLFGLTHVGILRWVLDLSGEVTWAWGFWTIFSGLVFGLVREKSGGILAPALLHGLPQAIATVAMLFM